MKHFKAILWQEYHTSEVSSAVLSCGYDKSS